MRLSKTVILSFLLILEGGFLYAQQSSNDYRIEQNARKNNILISFLADASMINVKYERMVKSLPFGFVSAGAGVGLGISGNSGSLYSSESLEEKEFFGTLPHYI